MKKTILLIILCMFITVSVYAQKNKTNSVPENTLPTVEQIFVGWAKFIGDDLIDGEATIFKGYMDVLEGTEKFENVYLELYAKGGKQLRIASHPSFGKAVSGFDGKKGWVKENNEKVRDMTYEELAEIHDANETGMNGVGLLLTRVKSKEEFFAQFKSTSVKSSKVEGRNTYLLELKYKSGTSERIYFDTVDFAPLKFEQLNRQNKVTKEIYASDYKTVGKSKLPFKLRMVEGKKIVNMRLTEFNIAAKLDDAIFRKPVE